MFYETRDYPYTFAKGEKAYWVAFNGAKVFETVDWVDTDYKRVHFMDGDWMPEHKMFPIESQVAVKGFAKWIKEKENA